MEDKIYSLVDKKTILESKKGIPNKKYPRRVYTPDEVQEILKDYIIVSENKYTTLKTGNTRICYIRKDDNSFCRGGYISVNNIEKKDGSETYFQLRGNISRRNKGMVTWLVPYSGITKLWVFCSSEYEFFKQEIKKSERKQREELSNIVDKVSNHLRKLKREIIELKKEIKELKGNKEDDNASVITDFSQLKVYRDPSESDIN